MTKYVDKKLSVAPRTQDEYDALSDEAKKVAAMPEIAWKAEWDSTRLDLLKRGAKK